MIKLAQIVVFATFSAFIANAQADTLASGGNSTSSTAMIGAIANTGVAGFMGYECTTAPAASKPMYCAMAALSAANALSNLASAKNGSAITAATTAATADGSSTPAVSTADKGLAEKLAAQDQAVLNAAAGQGVALSADGKSVTLPDGSSIPASQVGSDANMKANGLDDAGIAQLKAEASAAAAKAKSQYNVASMGTEDGGGGALNSRGGNGSGDDESGSRLKSLFSAMNKSSRKPASMSGLSKQLGNTGENIGVAGDDIFQMVSRQYQRKDSQNTFLKTP